MSKKEESKKVLLLSMGIVGAVGFAGWNIMNALNPRSRGPSEAAAPTSTASTQPSEVPAATLARTAPEPLANVRMASTQAEAHLAFGVDPFASNYPQPASQRGGVGTVGSGPSPGTDARPGEMTFGPNAGAETPVLPPTGPWSNVSPQTARTTPEFTLQLVGTMLGGQPSAVFKSEQSMVVVPVGQKVGSWRLVAVDHGMAKVRFGRELRVLTLSRGLAGGTVSSGGGVESPIPSPQPAERMASILPGEPLPEGSPIAATFSELPRDVAPELPVTPEMERTPD